MKTSPALWSHIFFFVFANTFALSADDSIWSVFEGLRKAAIKATAMSDSDEIRYGKTIAGEINRTKILVHPSESRYRRVIAIAREVAMYRKRQNIPLTIYLEETSNINAFAVAGGHVWVTTGLLNFIRSNDELAGIIGHELVHIDRKHCQSKIQIHVLVLKTINDTDLAGLANTVALILNKPYSQNDENEADYFGATMAFQAGYSPARMADFFVRMEAIYRMDLNRGKHTDIDRLLHSHPLNKERIQRIRYRAIQLMKN